MRNCQIQLSMQVKVLQEKTSLNNSGQQIWLWLFMFRPITLKQLNSLTSTDKFSCLGGLEVTHLTAVRQVPGSTPGSGKYFYVCYLLFCCCLFLFVLNTLFVIKLPNVNSFSIIQYLIQTYHL